MTVFGNIPLVPWLCRMLLYAGLTGPGYVHAQDRTVRYFSADALLDGAAMKRATEAVNSLDPAALVSFHQDQMKVLLLSSIPSELALEVLDHTGAHFRIVTAASGTIPGMLDRPVLIHTGDAAGDEARYQRAKQAWIEHYPEAYRASCAPDPGALSPAIKGP